MLSGGASSVSAARGSCSPSVGGGSGRGLAVLVVVQVGPPGFVVGVFPVRPAPWSIRRSGRGPRGVRGGLWNIGTTRRAVWSMSVRVMMSSDPT